MIYYQQQKQIQNKSKLCSKVFDVQFVAIFILISLVQRTRLIFNGTELRIAYIIRKYGGENVNLFGTWTHFQVPIQLTKSSEPPHFHEAQVNLFVGTYEYKYSIDGEWKYDHQEPFVPDNYGSFNNQIEVYPKRATQEESDDLNDQDEDEEEIQYQAEDIQNTIRTRIRTSLETPGLEVIGSWDNWKNPLKMSRRFSYYSDCYEHIIFMLLKPGHYQFIFKVGDQYLHDQMLPMSNNTFGTKNNILHVKKRIDFAKKSSNPTDDKVDTIYWSQYELHTNKFDRIEGHSMTRIGNNFYIFGGLLTSKFSNIIYKLSLERHELEVISEATGDLPAQMAFHNAVPYGNKILFYGGLSSSKIFTEHFVFNAANLTWFLAKTEGERPSPRERATLTLFAKDEILIYFGGYFCSQDLEVEEIYNDLYVLNIQYMRWKKLHFSLEQPEPRYAHTATQIKSQMFVFGGVKNSLDHSRKNFGDIWMLDFKNSKLEWQQLDKLCKGEGPAPRHGHTAVYLRQKICIFGGRGNHNVRHNDVYFFDPNNYTWIKPKVEGVSPLERFYHAADACNDELWILGGNAGMRKNNHFNIMSFEENDLPHRQKSPQKMPSEEKKNQFEQ